MAQTIWVHKLSDRSKSQGMDYLCEHLFQASAAGKTMDGEVFPDAKAKDGTAYRALFCGVCAKNYSHSGHVKLAKEMVPV